jgi:hypothetical protein
VEKRGSGDLYAAFFLVVAAVAAWRSWQQSPVAAWVMVAAGVLVVAFWVRWRFMSTAELAISGTEIVHRRGQRILTRVAWAEAARLEINIARNVAFLAVRIADQRTIFTLNGFDRREVGDACVAAGWVFRDR